jgi:hypothetical protein
MSNTKEANLQGIKQLNSLAKKKKQAKGAYP